MRSGRTGATQQQRKVCEVRIPARTETVIVGAGHAGVVMSHRLGQAGRDHVVLDRRSTLGGSWQDRWDDFRLVTPNWTVSLPGQPYDGPDPDGFMPRDEVVGRVAHYASTLGAPVHLGIEVARLAVAGGSGFRLETSAGPIDADSVVVATGSYHVPRIPPLASGLPAAIAQLHSHEYRNEGELPPGGVLVVGSGQSGVQIAEELRDAGRMVNLSVGSAPRVPRRYRGRDIFRWLADVATLGPKVGIGLPTVETLPDPRLRFAPNPHLSGHGGGHETNLRQLAAAGMTLVGRVAGIDGRRVQFAPGLSVSLDRADAFFGERLQPMIERYIALAGLDAPPDDRQPVRFDPPEIEELDLEAAGITTVLWATGYRPDFGWIDLPILDEAGFPKQHRGVTDVPGLYFLGLLWQHTQASATLFGPMLDAPYLLDAMGLATAVPVSGEASAAVASVG
jgi:putative flavoprotein involved in K+ transport